MSLLGIRLQILIGAIVPANPPPHVSEALQSVQVTHQDQGRSGFQLTFQIGRGMRDLMDYGLVQEPLLKPFHRVILVATFNATLRVLMDGIITNQQFSPSNQLGASTLTVTGEDVSVMLDLEEKLQSYPNQSDDAIVNALIGPYAVQYGLRADVHPPEVVNIPSLSERTSTQHSTDLQHILMLAKRHGHVFYITPGPVTHTNVAYWGPPDRQSMPQRALSMNMGPYTNVESISFQYNAMAANKVFFELNGERGQTVGQSTRKPQLVRESALLKRTVFFSGTRGLNAEQAKAEAQAMVNQSLDGVVTASGELDTLQYGELLEPRGLVALRGVGESYDGTFYVKSVTHKINVHNGEYKQGFSLSREGVGALEQVVRI